MTIYAGEKLRMEWVDGIVVDILGSSNGVDYTLIEENYETEIDYETEGQIQCFYDWTIAGEDTDTFYYKIVDKLNLQSAPLIVGPLELENRVLTTITVTPETKRLVVNRSYQPNAIARDQTNRVLVPQPEFVWTTDSVHGSVNVDTGFFTAGLTEEECIITATVGLISGSADVNIQLHDSSRIRSSLDTGIALTT